MENKQNQIMVAPAIEQRPGQAEVLIPTLPSGMVRDEYGRPAYELNSEAYCHKISYKRWLLYFYFKRYAQRDIRSVLNKIFPESRTVKGGVERTVAGSTLYEWANLFQGLFLYCHGLGITDVPEMREIFETEGDTLAEKAIRQHVVGFEDVVDHPPFNGTPEEGEEILTDSQVLINALREHHLDATMSVTLSDCDQQTGRFTDYSIDITHYLSKPSKLQKRIHEQAVKEHTAKKGVTVFKLDLESICLLYDELIRSIDGVTINGAKCVNDNQREWLPLVPAWWKLWTINTTFLELKNF